LAELLRHTIGEAAKLVGVSTAALRLWEKMGLIQPQRTPSGHRLYFDEDISCLQQIQFLRKEHGLNFSAIRVELSQQNKPHTFTELPPITNESKVLGRKLRYYRNRQKLTLKQVSHLSGLSVSFISAAERGVTGISLASLLKLSLAYNIHLSDIYEEGSGNDHKLVRSTDRQVYEQSLSGVRIEQLTHGPALMEAQRFVLEPGASSEGSYSHSGEELIYVLEGCVDFYLDELEHHHLETGDCLYFSSRQLHRWENQGTAQASLLWVDASIPVNNEPREQPLSIIRNMAKAKGRRPTAGKY
jgi:DNA-binding transcriptional MerR regulator/quercetin dioxygenase-like cupin family protein